MSSSKNHVKKNKALSRLPTLTVTISDASKETNDGGGGDRSSPGGGGMAKLNVPTPLLTNDNTPTPVRHLLREAEANGLFHDFRADPFAETFRKATKREEERGVEAAEKATSKPAEETLNTPQIIFPLPDGANLTTAAAAATTTASEVAPFTSPAKKYRPIVPAKPLPETPLIQFVNTGTGSSGPFAAALGQPTTSGQAEYQQAKLLIQLPNGQQPLHLSDIPVLKTPDQGKVEDTKERLREALSSKQGPAFKESCLERGTKRRLEEISYPTAESSKSSKQMTDEEKRRELLERNRAAAQRSRERKKMRGEETELKLRQMSSTNKNLVTENNLLREEVRKLKGLLRLHSDCPVTKENGMEEVIAEELRPKTVQYKSDVQSQIRIVTMDPLQVARMNAKVPPSEVVRVTSKDILREAALQIQDDDPPAREAPSHPHPANNPGYVRVTHNSISVKKATPRKSERHKGPKK